MPCIFVSLKLGTLPTKVWSPWSQEDYRPVSRSAVVGWTSTRRAGCHESTRAAGGPEHRYVTGAFALKLELIDGGRFRRPSLRYLQAVRREEGLAERDAPLGASEGSQGWDEEGERGRQLCESARRIGERHAFVEVDAVVPDRTEGADLVGDAEEQVCQRDGVDAHVEERTATELCNPEKSRVVPRDARTAAMETAPASRARSASRRCACTAVTAERSAW